MRAIAAISIVGIIAVAVIIGLLIQRLKNRQAEELEFQKERLALTNSQLNVARDGLRLIRDLQGDSSADAGRTLDQIDKLRDDYYEKEGQISR